VDGPTLTVAVVTAGASTDVLVQYGALGVLALLAIVAVRVLFQRETKSLDLERARADRLEQELARLNTAVQERTVPALTEATRVISEALEQMKGRP